MILLARAAKLSVMFLMFHHDGDWGMERKGMI